MVSRTDPWEHRNEPNPNGRDDGRGGSPYRSRSGDVTDTAKSPPASRPKIDAVILDLWYTTWYHRSRERANYHRAKRRAWFTTLAEEGVEPSRAGPALEQLKERLSTLESRGIASPLPQQARWVGRQLGVRVDARALVRRLNRALADAKLHLTPGLLRFLARVRSRGLPLGMVSNISDESSEGIRERLASGGLLRYFDAIVLSSEVGRAKPDPLPFLTCYRRLQVRPDRALFVGDLPVDGEGASRVGSHFVMYLGVDRQSPRVYRRKRATAPPETARARSWSEVADLYDLS